MADQKNPLKPILEQIQGILNFFHQAYKQKSKGEVSEDFSAQLEEITLGAEYVKKTYELALKESGITEKEVAEWVIQHPDYLTEKDKQLLNQITKLRIEAMAIRDAAEKFLKEEEKQKKAGRIKGKKKQPGRDVGTRKGWKKM